MACYKNIYILLLFRRTHVVAADEYLLTYALCENMKDGTKEINHLLVKNVGTGQLVFLRYILTKNSTIRLIDLILRV